MPCHPHRASGQGFEPRSVRSERAVLPVAPARDLSCQRGTRTHTVASNGPPRYPLRHLTMRAPGEIRTPTTQGRSLVLLSVELRALVLRGLPRTRTSLVRVRAGCCPRKARNPMVGTDGVEPSSSAYQTDALPLSHVPSSRYGFFKVFVDPVGFEPTF